MRGWLGLVRDRHAVLAVGRWMLLLVIALLLAGCGTTRFSSSFAEDGSASHALAITFARADLEPDEASRLELALGEAAERARLGALDVARIDTASQLGIRVSSTTANASDAGAALNNLLNTLLPDSTLGPIAPFTGTFTRESEAYGGTSFDLQLTVDGALLFQALQAQSPGNAELGSPASAAELMTFEYLATMPGTVKSTNGSQVGDASVRWDLPLDAVSEVNAVSNVGKDSNWIWIGLAIVAAATLTIGTATIVTAILLTRVRRLPTRLQPHDETHPATVREVAHSVAALVRRTLAGHPRPQPGPHPHPQGDATERDS